MIIAVLFYACTLLVDNVICRLNPGNSPKFSEVHDYLEPSLELMNDHQQQTSVDGVEQGIEVDLLLYSGLYTLLTA